MGRILTTHTGSLPRRSDLVAQLAERERGGSPDGFEDRVRRAVAETVRLQVEAGVDVVNDGEQGRVSYATYVHERLTGFEGEEDFRPNLPRDLLDHPEVLERFQERRGTFRARMPACTGEVRRRDRDGIHDDLERLREAADAAGARRLFMTAASPGVVAMFLANRHYPSREAYLVAVAEAMREEYAAIIEAGVELQLDCPDLAGGRHSVFANLSLEEFRREITLNLEVLDHAVRDLPPERMRLHLCWGNYGGPHTHDVPLRDILDLVLRARPAGLSLEAANPRHEHEWRVFEEVRLPDGKYLIPGVIDSTTNFVEHPELVAERLVNYARAVGPERVMTGTDCGFSTFASSAPMVATSVVWAKLRAMAEGAMLASSRLGLT